MAWHPQNVKWDDLILRLLVESAIIVVSILLALTVDQWKQQQSEQKLALRSLQSFQQEILQNRARIEDITPYHGGLRTMLVQIDSAGTIQTPADFRRVIGFDGFQPPALLEAAWQTALATGTLTYMDYETVSALSLTYSLQRRFQQYSDVRMPTLIRNGSVTDGDMSTAIYSTITYLSELAEEEHELQAVYDQALEIIASKTPPSPDSNRTAAAY